MHIELRPLVGLWFQVLFHSPPGVLFDFPSRYWFTFGQIRVFRLSPWSGWIPAEFPVLRCTWDTSRSLENLAYRTFTLSGVTSQTLLLFSPVPHWGPATPAIKMTGLACSLFARRYWGNPLRFLFLRLLRCFSSPRSLTLPIEFSKVYPGTNQGGFSHSEISGSKPVCDSPKHFAAYHVLHRLNLPSHSS